MPEQLNNTQPEQIIKQCQQLIQKGQLNEAAENLSNMLNSYPGHIEGIYCLAVCQRKQQKYNESISSLNQVLVKDPEHARAFQEQGYIYKSLGETSKAITAFDKAVTLNPALFGSWRVLSNEASYPKKLDAKKHFDWLSSYHLN